MKYIRKHRQRALHFTLCKDGIMGKLFSFIRASRAPAPSTLSVRALRSPRPVRVYRGPSHIIMVGNINDICHKLDQSLVERYCHIEV